MQQKQLAFAERIRSFAPTPYAALPDLGLYMDQVITYVQRQCAGLYPEGERVLTPATINNYVKCQLVTRPVDKKYGRDQLAQLLMLCTLKQAATIEEMHTLLRVPEGSTVEAMYAAFCQTQQAVFGQLAAGLPMRDPMTCAVQSAAYRFLCAEMLADVRQEAKEEAEATKAQEEAAKKAADPGKKAADAAKKAE